MTKVDYCGIWTKEHTSQIETLAMLNSYVNCPRNGNKGFSWLTQVSLLREKCSNGTREDSFTIPRRPVISHCDLSLSGCPAGNRHFRIECQSVGGGEAGAQ